MKNPTFTDDLTAWASLQSLRASSRSACAHSALPRPDRSTRAKDTHERYCIGTRLDLLDHARAFTGPSGRLVIAWCFRPRPHDPGHESWRARLDEYASSVGVTAHVPSRTHTLHTLYDTETCAVVYSARARDLTPSQSHALREVLLSEATRSRRRS